MQQRTCSTYSGVREERADEPEQEARLLAQQVAGREQHPHEGAREERRERDQRTHGLEQRGLPQSTPAPGTILVAHINTVVSVSMRTQLYDITRTQLQLQSTRVPAAPRPPSGGVVAVVQNQLIANRSGKKNRVKSNRSSSIRNLSESRVLVLVACD